ncbi:unnamed protein product [Lactuca virosa]|uniref:Uncharacterized protein n=1 Tax=Lactuca virosa TaxID=75947 RepID=A0AAU9LJW4_9ASTR|nr:unnamed protein product [Lactuca virosa]
MKDSLIAEILMLQTTTFVMSDPRNFEFVGSIPKVLMKRVLLDNAIIRAYRKLPSSGVRQIPESRDAPVTDFVGQILSEKLKPIFEKHKEIQNVTKSKAISQQGGEKEVNINNPYQTDPI